MITALSLPVVAEQQEDVHISDERPLAAAIRAVEKRCRCVITYEDVRWRSDQVEPSPLLRRDDGAQGMVPRGIPFTFSVPINMGQMDVAGIAQSLRHVLNQFESSQNPGKFRLVQGRTHFHVLPSQSAVLDTPISVNASDIPALNALRLALDKITQVSGAEFGLWRLPLNVLKGPVRVTVTNEHAYDVVGRILAAVDKSLSWHLFYDVNVNTYFLTVHRAYEAETEPEGAVEDAG